MGRARTVVILTYHHHNFSKTDKACTRIKAGMVAYLGDVSTVHVGTVIILYVANSTSFLSAEEISGKPDDER